MDLAFDHTEEEQRKLKLIDNFSEYAVAPHVIKAEKMRGMLLDAHINIEVKKFLTTNIPGLFNVTSGDTKKDILKKIENNLVESFFREKVLKDKSEMEVNTLVKESKSGKANGDEGIPIVEKEWLRYGQFTSEDFRGIVRNVLNGILEKENIS